MYYVVLRADPRAPISVPSHNTVSPAVAPLPPSRLAGGGPFPFPSFPGLSLSFLLALFVHRLVAKRDIAIKALKRNIFADLERSKCVNVGINMT